jgi:hypothetical protein
MKKLKTIKAFFFTDSTHKETYDRISKELPIGIKYNNDLVNRIYDKYPLLSKTEISIIVKLAFESIRELMVLGKILNFNNLFFDTKFHFFAYRKAGRILPALKVKISTPPPMRKNV